MIKYNYTYSDIIKWIEDKENFSFSRYGDGEWGAMLRLNPVMKVIINRDGIELVEFSDRLLVVIKKSPEYIIGIQNHAVETLGDIVLKYSKDLKNTCNSDILHNMSTSIGIEKFKSALKKRKSIIIGPQYLSKLNLEAIYIETPNKVWLDYESIKNRVYNAINECQDEDPVVLYSCTFAAKLMIDDNYDKFGSKITQIDMGSVWDPYCGYDTRSYHHQIIDKISPGSTGQKYFNYK